MISTTTIRERPQLLPHSRTETDIHRRLKHSPTSPWPDKLKVTTVDISLLLEPKDDDTHTSTESSYGSSQAASTPGTLTVAGSPIAAARSTGSPPASITAGPTAGLSRPPLTSLSNTGGGVLQPSSVPAKRPCRNFDQPSTESPAKKQSKWSPEEDAKIIQLRGDGMKWEDISKHLPGRSAISCRLHYQNYLERRSEWDEDRKNKLARLYERFKSDMWARIAEEMAIPWRAAEAMHWQMGEQEMARRAGVTPFSLTTNMNQQQQQQPHSHTSNGGMSQNSRPLAHVRSNSATPRMRRDSQGAMGGFGAPPTSSSMLIPPQLPSLAELTAGLPAYSGHNLPHPSPPILTPPHHLYNHSGASGYPFHQSRYGNGSATQHPLHTPSATPTQASRP